MSYPYRLHYAPDNASLVVRIALLELDQPFETVLVDRSARAQRSQAYLAVNPVGRIPTLETPDGPVFETAAILLWLSDRHGGLLPAPDDPTRGAALSWLFFLSNTLHAELRMLFHAHEFATQGLTEALCQALHRTLTGHFRLLDRLTGQGHAWIAGDALSALDLYLGPLLRWTALYPIGGADWFHLAQYPNLQTLALRLEPLACVQEAAKVEGLGETPFSAPVIARPPQGSAT